MNNHDGNPNLSPNSDTNMPMNDIHSNGNHDVADGVNGGVTRVVNSGVVISDMPYVRIGVASHVANGNVTGTGSRGISVSYGTYASNGGENREPNISVTQARNTAVSISERRYASDGGVNHAANVNQSQAVNRSLSISDRLARAANSQDRGRQLYLFFERYRFLLLNGQRDDRRHITRERVLLEQLHVFRIELEQLPESVLINRTLSLLRALIAIVELRIRAYSRNVSDASRMASCLMDYLADVMRI